MEFRITELEGGDVTDAARRRRRWAATAGTAAPAVAGSDCGQRMRRNWRWANRQTLTGPRRCSVTGDFRAAADLFKTFTETYPGGPLSGEALYLRGEALSQLGETADAARSYLEAFSGAPNGPRAGDALLKLGQSLGKLGQTPEACVTLTEVGVRFPGSGRRRREALTAMQGLGCS